MCSKENIIYNNNMEPNNVPLCFFVRSFWRPFKKACSKFVKKMLRYLKFCLLSLR